LSKRKRKLTPEQLAMGEQMIYSKKRANEMENWGWNRFVIFMKTTSLNTQS
jgi:hypothetical protein